MTAIRETLEAMLAAHPIDAHRIDPDYPAGIGTRVDRIQTGTGWRWALLVAWERYDVIVLLDGDPVAALSALQA